MIPKLLALLLLGLCYCSEEQVSEGSGEEGQIWAVIVAGSNGWGNYRHQADVCHLYQLLTKKHGIPRSNIITMMFNDIAYNPRNKYPGTIINAMHGTDVYEGVVIDYAGVDVTPANFMKVLRGEPLSVGSRKVLRSGPQDTVFVNFVDHGGPGIVGFPGSELHLVDLMETLDFMHAQSMYKQMLWYVETCYSGSMFEGHLKPNMNITAATAANAKESSYACVWDSDLGVWLGDCWSLNWMNNTEKIFPNLDAETVGQQYEIVKEMTKEYSHAQIYGDLSVIYKEPISTFLGHGHHGRDCSSDDVTDTPRMTSHSTLSMATPDILLDYLQRSADSAATEAESAEYEAKLSYHLATRERVVETLGEITRLVTGDMELAEALREEVQPIHHPHCNKQVLSSFFSACVTRADHPYIVPHLYWLTNLCNVYSGEVIVTAVRQACQDY